jgi:hypothetical protein
MAALNAQRAHARDSATLTSTTSRRSRPHNRAISAQLIGKNSGAAATNRLSGLVR